MNQKKTKITIECEGQPTQIIEANAIAAAILTDGTDDDHTSLQIVLMGHRCLEDLLHLRDAVGTELINTLETQLIDKMLLARFGKNTPRGEENESQG